MRARDLMAVDVIVIPATATVTEAAEILRRSRVSGAPVIDREGIPVGVFSTTDLAFGWGQEESEHQRVFYRMPAGQFLPVASDSPSTFGEHTVEELMTPLLFAVQLDDPVQEAALLMTGEQIHRVIVLEGTRLVGILSASDIVAAVGRGEFVEAH